MRRNPTSRHSETLNKTRHCEALLAEAIQFKKINYSGLLRLKAPRNDEVLKKAGRLKVTSPLFRNATLKDLDHLVDFENSIFTSDRIKRRSFKNFLRNNTADVFVVEMEKKIIGCAVILFRKNSSKARIYSIAIDESYHQKGLAQQLYQKIENAAIKRNCHTIYLEVKTTNARAIRFYEKHGFQMFGTYPQFYEDGTEALRMKKQL